LAKREVGELPNDGEPIGRGFLRRKAGFLFPIEVQRNLLPNVLEKAKI
jgi:hypothetical protein